MKKNASKWLKISLLALGVLLVAGLIVSICIGYYGKTSQWLVEDSERHLKEVYQQVNRSFSEMIKRNWGLLDSCDDYYLLLDKEDAARDDTMDAFIATKKEYWGFSDFCFISSDKKYRVVGRGNGANTVSGTGNDLVFDLWDELMAGENIMDGGDLDGKNCTFFASPVAHGTYRGFEFDAIAVTYTNSDIAAALNSNAFGKKAKCFIIKEDGSILFSTDEALGSFSNYLTYLGSERMGMSDADKQTILGYLGDADADTEAGYLQCALKDGETHCLLYSPVGYRDYFLLSDVPQSTVSTGFLQAQRATIRVLLIIFALIGVAVLAGLIVRGYSLSRRSRTELQYRERMFDVLSSSVDDIFIMLDPEKERVDYLSPNVERLLGIPLKDVRNNIRAMAKCAVDYNIIVPQEVLNEIPLNGSKFWECEYMHQSTGERRWYRVTIYHMSIRSVKKYIVVMSDRTVEQQMNQQLQEALDAAKSANEAKSNFLSNMSHDIRTPMNAIVGFSVLLEKDADRADKVREYTRKIMASSHHLLSLINDVLDMSKIESGKTSLNVDRFSLPELLEEINIILMPQAKAKEQDFSIRVQGTPPEQIIGDKLRLNQILINLLSNAVKYTQEGGKIEFTVRQLPQTAPQYAKLLFSVKDNGIGMSEEFQKEVFAPFSREINSVTNKIQGTGLGMAITKNLVDLMGGIIRVESKLGEGSTFTVEMSFALPDPEEADGWFRSKVTRMLVADDEEEICLNIREMMRDTGVDVCYATSGEEAVAAAVRAHEHREDFSVILLDWKMPVMDGVETARKIREKVGADVPILVLTSYDWSEIEPEARAAGINAFMPKPFFTSTFREVIKPFFLERTEELPPPAPAEAVLNGMLFLVAEDNELNAEILTEMLDMEGAKCELAVNGKQAVEMFLAADPDRYDMILMDVQMPVMNGYEATRAIRISDHPRAKTIPILAMTANTFAEDVRNALDSGMNGHLAKPINMDAVKELIAKFKRDRDPSRAQKGDDQ